MSFTENYFEKKVKLVMKQIYPDLSISKEGVKFLYFFFDQIHDMMNDSISFLPNKDENTLQSLVQCFFNKNELGKYAIVSIKNPNFTTVLTEKIWKSDDSLVQHYLSVTFEYLVAEVLELGGNVASDNQKKRVVPFHYWYAISNDAELYAFFKFFGFDDYRFPIEELKKNRARLNNFLYHHTKDGSIYQLKKDELFEKYKSYL
jgi:hypothetical protein